MTQTSLRTAGIWIVQDHILLESLADRDLWGIPGGRLEPDESAEEGCRREYREELGIEMACLDLALIHENFWQAPATRMREYGFYFRVQPKDRSISSPLPIASRQPQLKFAWFRLEELPTLDFIPNMLKPILAERWTGTRFLSTSE